MVTIVLIAPTVNYSMNEWGWFDTSASKQNYLKKLDHVRAQPFKIVIRRMALTIFCHYRYCTIVYGTVIQVAN
jgi:hypothetical protein